MTTTCRPAIDFPPSDLAALLNQGFAEYIVPINFSAGALLSMLTRDSVDLSQSQVVERDGKPVAIGLIARCGWTARLAAMGVVAEARGQGIGKILLTNLIDSLRSADLRALVLEVIENNPPAVALYQGAGFQQTRRLVSFSYQSSTPRSSHPPALPNLTTIDIATVAGTLTSDHLTDLPWQLSGLSLMVDAPPSQALQAGHSSIVITDPAQPRISIRTIYVDPAHRRQGNATRLVAAVQAAYPGKSWHIPALCPEELSPIFTRNGFQVGELSQLQMKLKL